MDSPVDRCQLWICLFRVSPERAIFAGSLKTSAAPNFQNLEELVWKTRCWYSGTCLSKGLGQRCQKCRFDCRSQQGSNLQVCEAFRFGPKGRLRVGWAWQMSTLGKSCSPCCIQDVKDVLPEDFIHRSDLHQFCRSFRFTRWSKHHFNCVWTATDNFI
jgi:hypothetical protein